MESTVRIVLSLWWVAAAGTALGAPPPTDEEPVTLDFHGTGVEDPYLWLEGSDAPELGDTDAELDKRVSEWTDRQNAYTRRVLDKLPGRDVLEQRLSELLETGAVGLPRVRGERLFYTERKGSEAQPVLYLREGRDGEPVELLNLNSLDPEGLTAMEWFEPSQDGELVAFGLYRSGDELSTLYLLEVPGGEWLAEEIPGRVDNVSWLADSTGFVYRRLRELDDPYSGQIKFHRVGRHHRQDPVLFEQYKEGPLATTWGPYPFSNDELRWLAVLYWTGTQSNDLWVYDFEHWRETGQLVRVDILSGEDATAFGVIAGNTLYMRTTLDAPNGRVIAVDLENPHQENWREIIPERDNAVIRGLDLASEQLVVTYLKNAYSRIERFDLKGRSRGELTLPGIGTVSVSTEDDRPDAFFSYESFNEPYSVYWVDLEKNKSELWERPVVPVNPDLVQVEQVSYPSKDGTEITMFLVHRKDLERDGSNPTMLYGYGGFNIARTPEFSASLFPWLEAGGIYAVANLRGGGEYGKAWHRAGMLGNKQNVFDDFIAAGEWLIEQAYTSPQHLGIRGGSNGGLLTGAAVTQRPDLFAAAHTLVPLLDMLRYQYFLMARYWVPEYGSSEDPEQFEFLFDYSPYHRVRDGVGYPAVLLTAGENDARVHPLHARKMAAKMQAATASDPDEKPILLWVEREAGHGRGKPLYLRVREAADQLIFMAWQTGLDFAKAEPVAAVEY